LAYLAFGWGDRGFYLTTPSWADLRLSTALGALTGLDSTVIHVEAMPPPAIDAKTRRLRLSPTAYRALAHYVAASFAGAAAAPIPGAHYNTHDEFFEARGHYSVFATCNEWARRGLAVAWVRTALWSPFDIALFYQLPVEAPQ
jgi:uncharacterized protein (TIGR02117 family)